MRAVYFLCVLLAVTTHAPAQVVESKFVEYPTIEKPAPSQELLQSARSFRLILRFHFGDGAETNKAVTLDAVTAYFVQRRLTIPQAQRMDDASDTLILLRGYEAILAYTGTGHIWEFPWEMLDE